MVLHLNLKVKMTNSIKETLIAFCTGDVLATIVAFNLMSDIGYPVVISVLTGLIGGFCALLGKDIYKKMFRKK